MNIVMSTLNTPPSSLIAPALWRRMSAWLYEGVLMFGVLFLAGYLFSSLTQSRHALERVHQLQAFLFVVIGIYFIWFWSRGQTLPMKTWNIRIVDRNGQRLTQSRALLRYLLAWVWFLPSLLFIQLTALHPVWDIFVVAGWVGIWALLSRLHPQRQFWHDAWAGTRLVSK